MMSVEDYYKAPPDSIFEDIKTNAIKIWDTYDNTYGYRDEKVNRIKDLENISDNAWFTVLIFSSLTIPIFFISLDLSTERI